MASIEKKEGKTPNGGVRSEVHYLDDNGNPVDKEQATRGYVIEFDDMDIAIMRHEFRL